MGNPYKGGKKASDRRYRLTHREEIKDYHAASYRLKNKEKLTAYSAEWARTHKEAKARIDARYYSKHTEVAKERSRRYKAEHPETRKAYKNANKERDREQRRIYRANHPSEVRQADRKYYITHREQIRVSAGKYAASHKEQIKLYRRTHYAVLPAPTILRSARRRARKRDLPDTLTLAQWEAIKKAYGFKCAYCGSKPKKLTQDHVVPLIQGGGTTPDNIVPACLSCNARKGARPPLTLPSLRLLL